MKKELQPSEIYWRAQWAILRDFDSGFFAAIKETNPLLWPDCEARTVAEHLQCMPDAPVYEVWHAFPGGFPRFLDMKDRVMLAAKNEQGKSTIDWFSVALADDVLRKQGQE